MKNMNTKRFIVLGLLSAMVLCGTPAVSRAAADKVGYVNLSFIFDSYQKTKEYDASLEKEAEAKRAERETLVAQIKKLRDDIELLSEDKRGPKQGEIDNKVQELQAFDKDARENLRHQRDTMLKEILKEIDDVVREFGQSEGYEYIFNDRVLIYKNEANDLSNEILKRLNGKV